MLLFSTVLEINSKMTRESFMALVTEWNQCTPHIENRIPDLVWKGEKSAKWGTDDLWLAVEDYPKQSTMAIRYEKREKDGIVWDTDYVMNFRNMKMAIRLDRSYAEDALLSDGKFSAPHFITLLIEKGYLKDDGAMPILREPILINEDNVQLLTDVINANVHYKYPIVYVSKTYYNEDPVNVHMLANRLKGIAHVLVQNDYSSSMLIKELCGSKNEYRGAIGIYFPNQTIKKRKYIYRRYTGYDPFMLENVVQAVLQYSNSQMVDSLFTWQGVNNALLLDRVIIQSQERQAAENARRQAEEKATILLESLNDEEKRIRKQAYEDAKAEADELLLSFDSDIQKMQEQIAELTRANEALQFENQGLRAKINNSDNVSLLLYGYEYDFYQGEIKDLVLSVLQDALKSIPERTRRYDVVKDVIRNNDYQKISETRAEEIKRLLKGYDGMPARLKQDLEAYGFEVKEDGKHYKILYYGDGRYSDILSKTPSDWRTGKTSALKLIRIAF